jgi:hypothetical protein
MSTKILTNFDFTKNQIINVVVHNEAELSLISNPREGQIAYSTSNHRLYYYNGTRWEGADAIDALENLNGDTLIDYINDPETIQTINNDRLTNSTITLGTTTVALGGSSNDIAGATINSITLSRNTSGYSISGGLTTSKALTLSGNTTLAPSSITFESDKSITALYAGLTIGDSVGTGNITLKSNNAIAKVLTLTNENLELAGTGTKLTINNTPTISGTGSVTLTTGATVSLGGDSLALFNRDLTVGTTGVYSKDITIKTTEDSDTPNVIATFPKVSDMTFVGVDTIQNLTNKTINGLTITPVTGKTLDLSVASFKSGSGTNTGSITITSDSTTARTLTLGGSVTLNGESSATLNTPLTVGATSTYTGSVVIRSSGSGATTIIGPSSGTTTLLDGTMVEDQDERLHMQNTDVGTDSTSFYFGTNGVKLKSANIGTPEIELQVRDHADSDYASIRVKDLYVEGTQTVINTDVISIEDNILELNNGVTASEENTDAGIEIKRYHTSATNTPQPVSLIFNESTGRWQATYINTNNNGDYTKSFAMKHSITIGDGIATQFDIIHNMNTRDAMVTIRETNSPYAMVYADVQYLDVNTVRIIVSDNMIPTAGQYTVTVIG